MRWALLFLAGGAGVMLRYALAGAVQTRTGGLFPWGTFAVNVLGCLAVGVMATWLEERSVLAPELRVALLVGLLGGFTTFSTFGLETWRLLAEGESVRAFANVAGSLVVGLLAVVAGVRLARWLA